MPTRRAFLSCGAALAASSAFPAALFAGPPRLGPPDLARDVEVLRHALLSLHPGLFRYQDEGRFDGRVEALRAFASRPRSLADFFLRLARFTAAIRCGHTFPNPFNQPRMVRDALLAGRDRLPFSFVWLNGRMIVTGVFAEGPLRPGDEIAEIDGVPVRRLLAALLPLARADGGNGDKRVAQMEVRPGERYQAFDVYRPLLFPPPTPGTVAVRLRRGRAPLRLEALGEDDRQRTAASRADPKWRFGIEEGVARLAMPTWAVYDSPFDWRAFLGRALDRIASESPRGLVVDLRGNEGGLDCGDPILARLIAAPLAKPAYRPRVRYRSAPAALLPYLDTYNPAFRDWGARASGPDADGFFDLAEAAGGERVIAPAAPGFAGRVAVLADSTNSSATFNFLRIVRDNQLATILGAPSGGNRRGLNGSAYFFLRLPASGIEIDIPLVGSFPLAPQPDGGIAPDIPVANSASDYRAGRDRVMQAAIALLG